VIPVNDGPRERSRHRAACHQSIFQEDRHDTPRDVRPRRDDSSGQPGHGAIHPVGESLEGFYKGTTYSPYLLAGRRGAATATLELIGNFAQGTLDPALVEAYSPGGTAFDDTWQQIIDAAEDALRARPLHHLHRLRMDLAGQGATTCTATSSSATGRTRRRQVVPW
jgi:hypothetical protein